MIQRNYTTRATRHIKIYDIEKYHLNLPTRFVFPGGQQIDLLYAADGTKLRKTVKQQGTTLSTRDYLNGVELLDGKVEAIYHREGRVYNTNVSTSSTAFAWRYEYAIRDHLGNTRLMFTDKDGDGTIEQNAGEVLQEDHYYPFGMRMDGRWQNDPTVADNAYQYNGKELNEDFGLEWLDYGARWYDPAVGRFPSVDPIISRFPYLTPYNYASNDPVGRVDLWGLQGIPFQRWQQQAANLFNDLFGTSIPRTSGEVNRKPVYNQKDIGNGIKKGGENIEAAGLAIMVVVPPVGAKVTGVGAVLQLSGDGLILNYEYHNEGMTTEAIVSAGVNVAFEILPAPIEDAIERTGAEKAAKEKAETQLNIYLELLKPKVEEGINSNIQKSSDLNCIEECQ